MSLDRHADWSNIQSQNPLRRNNNVEKFITSKTSTRTPKNYSWARIARVCSSDDVRIVDWCIHLKSDFEEPDDVDLSDRGHVVAVLEKVQPARNKVRWVVTREYLCWNEEAATDVLNTIYTGLKEQGLCWESCVEENAHAYVRETQNTECFFYFKKHDSQCASMVDMTMSAFNGSDQVQPYVRFANPGNWDETPIME